MKNSEIAAARVQVALARLEGTEVASWIAELAGMEFSVEAPVSSGRSSSGRTSGDVLVPLQGGAVLMNPVQWSVPFAREGRTVFDNYHGVPEGWVGEVVYRSMDSVRRYTESEDASEAPGGTQGRPPNV